MRLNIDETVPSTYPVSMGTNAIVECLNNEMASAARPKPISLVLMNIWTLIRNAYSPETNALGKRVPPTKDKILQVLKDDIIYLCEVFERYGHSSGYTPVVVCYIPDYIAVPKDNQKVSSTDQNRLITEAVADFKKMINGQSDKLVLGNIKLHVEIIGDRYTHVCKALTQLVRKYTKDYHLGPSYIPYVITHILWDLHNPLPDYPYVLIESYTGKIKTMRDLAFKLFDTHDIPFNIYAHALFGDKYLIKSSLKPKKKKEIKEAAEKHRWRTRTTQGLKEALISRGVLIPSWISAGL